MDVTVIVHKCRKAPVMLQYVRYGGMLKEKCSTDKITTLPQLIPRNFVT